MSRGPYARSQAIGEPLPESLVTLMRIDLRAQQHALVEGAPDPFPSPRTRGRARERAKAVAGPPGGCGTHVANPGGTPTPSGDQSCVHNGRSVYPSGGDCDE